MNRSTIAKKLRCYVTTLRRAEQQGLLPRINDVGAGAYESAARLYLAARSNGVTTLDLKRAWHAQDRVA